MVISFIFGGNKAANGYDNATNEAEVATEQEYTASQYNVGLMYERGEGVAQDYKEAIKWYGKDAEQGDRDAQFRLSLMYGKGLGVDQDYIEAYKWCILASEQGNENAIKLKQLLPKELTEHQIAEGERLAKAFSLNLEKKLATQRDE